MSPGGQVPAVDVTGARAEITAGCFVLDVREPHEFGEGHVAEAVNIPLGTLADQRDDVPLGVRVVCVCRSGNRSARATAFLRDCGVDAVNLDGGMLAWHAEGHPLVDRHGAAGWVA